MKRCFLFLFLVFFLISGQAFASEQKLAHGAGTLPHLTRAVTLNIGIGFPKPLYCALQYNIGLGNRVQLGLSASVLPRVNSIEINSMFNVLKTANDSDFLSLCLNPSMDLCFFSLCPIRLISGIAYEHRFGDIRRFGLYTKIGVIIDVWPYGWEVYMEGLDCRVGFQALLNKRFSLTLEPMLILLLRPSIWLQKSNIYPTMISHQ